MTPAATATRPWTPTIDDIEGIIETRIARWGRYRGDALLKEAIDEYGDAVDHTVPNDDGLYQGDQPEQLWRDLPPSQATRLRELTEAAKERAFDRAYSAILAELEVAAQAFAAEFPNATRPEVTA